MYRNLTSLTGKTSELLSTNRIGDESNRFMEKELLDEERLVFYSSDPAETSGVVTIIADVESGAFSLCRLTQTRRI